MSTQKALDGKVAIVTGAGQGIGKGIALRLAREGAIVVINDVYADRIDTVVAEIRDNGGKALPFKANVSKKAEVEELCRAAAEECGGVHILVNNAFVRRNAPLFEVTEEHWDTVIGVGLKGTFFCIQAAAKYMVINQYGKIINIASVGGMGAEREHLSVYSATKAGVMSLTRVAARALGPSGINVNCVAPGGIETPHQFEGAKIPLEERKKSSVLGRIGYPQDIANLALFLASDESSFITGQVIACEGGRTDFMLA